MKQANEMTAHPILTDAFSWSGKFKFSRKRTTKLQQRITNTLVNQAKYLVSIGMVLLIGGLFLAGSYLFFVQLAKYGW